MISIGFWYYNEDLKEGNCKQKTHFKILEIC